MSEHRLARLFATACALGCAAGAAAQGLVIRAQGPGAAAHPVGSTLAAGALLAAGDRIDVLERGGTRQLVGPARYVPAMRSTASANVRLVVTQLLDRRQVTRRAGVVDAAPRESSVRSFSAARASAGPVRSEREGRYDRTLWMIDTTTSGTTCFGAGSTPLLWRPRGAAPTPAALVPQGGRPLPVTWAGDTAIAPFPAPPPAAPATYFIKDGGAAQRVTLVPIAVPATLDDLVVALDHAGCRAQLGYLLDQYPSAP